MMSLDVRETSAEMQRRNVLGENKYKGFTQL